MRILLIQPPARDFYESAGRLTPLGLCCLKSALRSNIPDSEVKVLDGRAGRGRKTVKFPPELSFLKEFYAQKDISPFSTFSAYYHFGADYAQLVAEAEAYSPDLIGVSCLFSAYHAEALDLAAALKEKMGTAPVVFGGPHASAAPRQILESGVVDFVVRGEGERPLVALVRALGEGATDFSAVPNLVWKDAGRIVENSVEPNFPMETLPDPDASDLNPGNYRAGREPLATLAVTRGCPHGCAFCSVGEIFGKRHRMRPTESILAEIRKRRAGGYRAFDFEDDNLTLGGGRFHELLRGIIDEYGEGGLSLSAMNGINYQELNGPTLDLMRRAGFSHLNVSLVSHDEGRCRSLGRPASNRKFFEVVNEAAGMGFLVTGYLILGLPGESVEIMVQGLAFLAELPLLVGVSPFYLAPGMRLWEGEPTRERLMLARLTALGQGREGCTREDVYTLFICARIVNFLKGLSPPTPVAPLEDLLSVLRPRGGRDSVGAEILDILLKTGRMRGWDGNRFFDLNHFRSDLFSALRGRAKLVACRSGQRILLS